MRDLVLFTIGYMAIQFYQGLRDWRVWERLVKRPPTPRPGWDVHRMRRW